MSPLVKEIRKGIFAAAIAFLTLMLSACGSNGSAAVPVVSMYELQKSMLAADSTLPEMSSVNGSAENAEESFAYLSKLPYEKVEAYFLAYSAYGKADEIAVIAVKDTADLTAAKKSLDASVEGRLELYKQYDPTQVSRVEEALVFTEGRYAVLIISDNADAVRTAFSAFIADAE